MKKWNEIIRKNCGRRVAVKDLNNPLYWVQKNHKDSDIQRNLSDPGFGWSDFKDMVASMAPQEYERFLGTQMANDFIGKFLETDKDFRRLPAAKLKIRADLMIVRSLQKIDSLEPKISNPMVKGYLSRARKFLMQREPDASRAYEQVSAAHDFMDLQVSTMTPSDAQATTGLLSLIQTLREASMLYSQHYEAITRALVELGQVTRMQYETKNLATDRFIGEVPNSNNHYN